MRENRLFFDIKEGRKMAALSMAEKPWLDWNRHARLGTHEHENWASSLYSRSFIGSIMRLANKGEVFLEDSEVPAIETALSNS